MPKWLKPLARLWFGSYTILVFGILALGTVILVAVVPGLKRRRKLVRGAARAVFAGANIPLSVRGLEHIPDDGCVVVANHASYLDGVLLTAVLPPHFAFVIKREMTRIPLAHFLLRRIGSEFVERFDPHRSARDARRILSRVGHEGLVLFPEGTFRREPGLRRFHNGAFAAAVHGRVPVVPVAIRGSRAMLPAESILPAPGRLEVVVLPPLRPVDGEEPVRSLLHQARQAILAEVGEPDLHPSPATETRERPRRAADLASRPR